MDSSYARVTELTFYSKYVMNKIQFSFYVKLENLFKEFTFKYIEKCYITAKITVQ